MKRRALIKLASQVSIGALTTQSCLLPISNNKNDVVIGHGDFRYKIDLNWGTQNPNAFPINDCHEMVVDHQGRIILLTNHTKNNLLIYNQSGKIVSAWGHDYPGAHGLTLHNEGSQEFLYITDTMRNEVIKTDLNGKVYMTFPYPDAHPAYNEKSQYKPTETAIANNGDIYIADGYGLQYILHYSSKGVLLNAFGGYGDNDNQFTNAHGICIDRRSGKETLLITDRMKNKLKRFSLTGELLKVIDLPGIFMCRPVIKGENVFLATIWSFNGGPSSGFISILDINDHLVSAPGGSTPRYLNGSLKKMHQTLKIFTHPHDVCIDQDDNLYVAQWNSGQTYPIKLYRV